MNRPGKGKNLDFFNSSRQKFQEWIVNSTMLHTLEYSALFYIYIYMYRLSNLPIHMCSWHIEWYTRRKTNVIYFKFKLFLFIVKNNTNSNNNNWHTDALHVFTYVKPYHFSSYFWRFVISSWKNDVINYLLLKCCLLLERHELLPVNHSALKI